MSLLQQHTNVERNVRELVEVLSPGPHNEAVDHVSVGPVDPLNAEPGVALDATVVTTRLVGCTNDAIQFCRALNDRFAGIEHEGARSHAWLNAVNGTVQIAVGNEPPHELHDAVTASLSPVRSAAKELHRLAFE